MALTTSDVGNVTQGQRILGHQMLPGCAQHTEAFPQLFQGFLPVQRASLLQQGREGGGGQSWSRFGALECVLWRLTCRLCVVLGGRCMWGGGRVVWRGMRGQLCW